MFVSGFFRFGTECVEAERFGILVARSTLRVPCYTLHVSIITDGFGLAQAATRKAEEEAAAAAKKKKEEAARNEKEVEAAKKPLEEAAKKAQEEAAMQV